jgi:hypothetical protein
VKSEMHKNLLSENLEGRYLLEDDIKTDHKNIEGGCGLDSHIS